MALRTAIADADLGEAWHAAREHDAAPGQRADPDGRRRRAGARGDVGPDARRRLRADVAAGAGRGRSDRRRAQPIEGTLAGRAFARGEVVVVDERPARRCGCRSAEGSERLGVLELTHPTWTDELPTRARPGRARPGAGADQQAPLHRRRPAEPAERAALARRRDAVGPAAAAHVLDRAGVGERHPRTGVLDRRRLVRLRPQPERAEFAIVDAVGHGMRRGAAVAVLAINSLRNARREGPDLETGLPRHRRGHRARSSATLELRHRPARLAGRSTPAS